MKKSFELQLKLNNSMRACVPSGLNSRCVGGGADAVGVVGGAAGADDAARIPSRVVAGHYVEESANGSLKIIKFSHLMDYFGKL